ncbi:hypothetical protein JKP88DRAFT_149533, partial [Tribonema minus]
VRIINGEIVQDNDPRLRQRTQSAATTARGGFGAGDGAARPTPSAAAMAGGAAESPLQRLADMLGVKGKTITIPAVFGVPSRDVEVIHLLLVAAVSLIFGWKALAFTAVLYVVQTK